MTITTLADLLSVFAITTESTKLAAFAEGDALLLSCEPETLAALGYTSIKALLADVGDATGMSRRALDYRRSVALAFGPGTRDEPVSWTVYRAASETNDPATWLRRAVEGNLSASKLHDEYTLATGRAPETVTVEYVTRTADAMVTVLDQNKLVLRFDGKIGVVSVGDRVQVTITRILHGSAEEKAA